jgi:hypothetical protein
MFPILIIVNALYIIKQKYIEVFNSRVFQTIMLLFVVANIVYAKTTIKDFYKGGKWHYVLNDNFYQPNFRHFIDSIGIAKNDKVISLPDITPNVSLYAIGRPGWSDYNYLKDTNAFNNAIRAGAKYLIIANPDLLSTPIIENYTLNFFANYNNIYIYKIDLNSKSNRNKLVKLKTNSNKYLSWVDDQSSDIILTDSINAKSFYMLDIGNGVIGFKTNNGRYIACNIMDDRKLFINTTWFGNWESFNMQNVKGNAIKTKDGKFLNLNDENNIIRVDNAFSNNSIIIL